MQIFCLTLQGHFALVIRRTVLSRPTLFSSRGGEVFNEAEPCNIHAKNPPQKSTLKKIPHQRSSTFDQYKVTARGSAVYPRVRQSAQKSPKGAAGLAQQVHKFEVFSKRLSVQKWPKGAAKLAQQGRKSKSSPKDNPRKSRLRVQPD